MAAKKAGTKAKDTFDTLKSTYFKGKVKPTLNKAIVAHEDAPADLDILILICKCLSRGKDLSDLPLYADKLIDLAPSDPRGYFYNGLALKNTKGKEQDSLKNFNKALELDPLNVEYLFEKASTHFLLFKDYHLPLSFAEKHRVKGEESLLKIISIVESIATPSPVEFYVIGKVSLVIEKNIDAKKYFIKAVNEFENLDELEQDANILKDIIKAQKECVKLINAPVPTEE